MADEPNDTKPEGDEKPAEPDSKPDGESAGGETTTTD